jgi:hypothetical protein
MAITTNLSEPRYLTGVGDTSLREDVATSALALLSSAGGFGMSRSTLWGLKGNNPEAAHPASMFLLVIALSLAGWYRYVKCSLPMVSTRVEAG